MSQNTYTSILISKKQLTGDTYLYAFTRPMGFDFSPGQYLRLILDYPVSLPGENTRLFSIASSPEEKDHLLLLVKMSGSVYKTVLLALNPGARVEIMGPMGTFILKPDSRIMLISGGVGLAPFYGFLRHIYHSNLHTPTLLLSSYKHNHELLFDNEIKAYVSAGWLIRHNYVTQDSPEAHDLSGRITKDILETHLKQFWPDVVYICGSVTMVESIKNDLLLLNFPTESILTEKFPET